MKKLPIFIIAALFVLAAACKSDEETTWDEYKDWREMNEVWIQEQSLRVNSDGTPYFQRLSPKWDPKQYILIHYFNDRSETLWNLSPLYTSTVDAKYIGRLYNDEAFDSSYNLRTWGDSIYRTRCSDVIPGWLIALEDMRVGDSCEIIVPYQSGYGAADNGIIKPFSALHFNMKLVDIPFYETKN